MPGVAQPQGEQRTCLLARLLPCPLRHASRQALGTRQVGGERPRPDAERVLAQHGPELGSARLDPPERLGGRGARIGRRRIDGRDAGPERDLGDGNGRQPPGKTRAPGRIPGQGEQIDAGRQRLRRLSRVELGADAKGGELGRVGQHRPAPLARTADGHVERPQPGNGAGLGPVGRLEQQSQVSRAPGHLPEAGQRGGGERLLPVPHRPAELDVDRQSFSFSEPIPGRRRCRPERAGRRVRHLARPWKVGLRSGADVRHQLPRRAGRRGSPGQDHQRHRAGADEQERQESHPSCPGPSHGRRTLPERPGSVDPRVRDSARTSEAIGGRYQTSQRTASGRTIAVPSAQ